MAQAAELQQWRHHHFSLVVFLRCEVGFFMVVGQARFVCLFYGITAVFQLYHGGDMTYEIEPTLLLTQGILTNLLYDIYVV